MGYLRYGRNVAWISWHILDFLSFNYILTVAHIYIGYMVFQSVTLLVPERVLLLKNVTRTESSLESENLQSYS
jgi:hypothetical protein